MYHGSKSSIREKLPSCQPPFMSETCRNAIIVEASPILCKLSNVSADNFYEFAVVFYNYVVRLACTDNKHNLGICLASKVPIQSDVGNTRLLLCAIHDNSVISFPPTINDSVFQISSRVEKADQKIIALHCIKVRYSFMEI